MRLPEHLKGSTQQLKRKKGKHASIASFCSSAEAQRQARRVLVGEGPDSPMPSESSVHETELRDLAHNSAKKGLPHNLRTPPSGLLRCQASSTFPETRVRGADTKRVPSGPFHELPNPLSPWSV